MAAPVDAGYGCDDFGCNGGVQDWDESPGYPSRGWAEMGRLQASNTRPRLDCEKISTR